MIRDSVPTGKTPLLQAGVFCLLLHLRLMSFSTVADGNVDAIKMLL